jgi:hypothetical protein
LAAVFCAGGAFAAEETVTMTPGETSRATQPIPQPVTATPGSQPLMTQPIRTATGIAPLSGEVVRLSPVDGVWVGVPKGWIACDDDNAAKLGNARDTFGLAAKICVGPRKPGNTITFGAFDPRPYNSAAVFAGLEAPNSLTTEVIDQMTDATIAQLQTASCPIVVAAMFGDRNAVESCTLNRSSFAGHPAMVYRITYVPPLDLVARSRCEIWMVPYSRGVLDFNFTWPVLEEEKVIPSLDKIRASVQIQ